MYAWILSRGPVDHDKDKKKINNIKGKYKERTKKFIEFRRKDPIFRQVETDRPVGKHGKFNELDVLTMEDRWKSTSQPYGIIAHKRYLEYLSKLPPGPNEVYLENKKQRGMDSKLHDDNKHGRLEETKKMIKARIYKEFLAEEARQKALTDVDIFKGQRERNAILDKQQFAELRRYPTQRQARQSLQGWHKGKSYKFKYYLHAPYTTLYDVQYRFVLYCTSLHFTHLCYYHTIMSTTTTTYYY